CPLWMSSQQMERPTLPAPITATRTATSLLRLDRVQPVLELWQGATPRHQVQLITLLIDGLRGGDQGIPQPGHERHSHPEGLLDLGQPPPDPAGVDVDLPQHQGAAG